MPFLSPSNSRPGSLTTSVHRHGGRGVSRLSSGPSADLAATVPGPASASTSVRGGPGGRGTDRPAQSSARRQAGPGLVLPVTTARGKPLAVPVSVHSLANGDDDSVTARTANAPRQREAAR